MDKNAIKKYAIWARRELIARVSQKAAQFEIEDDKTLDRNAETVNGVVLTPVQKKQRTALVDKINAHGYEQVMEEVAYTWFNRFCALRFMEVNNYLPTHIRIFTNEENEFKPQIIDEAIHLELEGLDIQKVYDFKENNDNEGLYKYLIITECNALGKILPGMFEKISDYTELLFPDNILREGSVIEQLVSAIPQEDWQDAVQIIGWLYQYYNTEKKDDVFAALKKNVKISKDNIPAATQLFTPDWIVRYMVENSVGRWYYDGMKGHLQDAPDISRMEALKSNWKYYLDEAEQTENVQEQLDKIRFENEPNLDELKVIDPCMGSGHILVYAFDVLMQIYQSCGYSERDAVKNIVEKNLYGLDIDDRAAQLAYFAVMMKARQYDRRFLTRDIKPNIYAITESNGLDSFSIYEFIGEDENIKEAFNSIMVEMKDAKEYGSILNISPVNFELLYNRVDEFYNGVSMYRETILNGIAPLIKVAEMLSQKYDAVITNPPYMGANGMGAKLSEFTKKNYPNSKSDLFSVFIEHCNQITKNNGTYGMIVQPSLVSLASFEKLRNEMLNTSIIRSMLHMGRGIFGIDFGSLSFVASKISLPNYCGEYFKLYKRTFQYIEPTDIESLFLLTKDNCALKFEFENYDTNVSITSEQMNDYDGDKIHFSTQQSSFAKIPGTPFAYWLSDRFVNIFNEAILLGDIADSKQGIATADNNRFLREWYEVNNSKIMLDATNSEEAKNSNKKWFPYNKGGEFRKWYGNNDYVVNWENDGYELRNFQKSVIRNPNYYFRESASWSLVSAGVAGFRYKPKGHLFDVGGMSFFSNTKLKYLLALCNTHIATKVLEVIAPTINYQCGDIANIPVIESEIHYQRVEELAESCIDISQIDWDSFETSWDFRKHPLVPSPREWAEQLNSQFADTRKEKFSQLAWHYKQWEHYSESRFDRLKENEEKLNRIFIDIYGLQDELTPEVEDKDVTVRKADLQRDIKSLISYAVGCMFGRYSPYQEGLVYAGGNWDYSKYESLISESERNLHGFEHTKPIHYLPDADNIIPICDDDYFEDDIVGKFVNFIETIYGEETLEENLQFIADALGGNGKNARVVIRNYFLNDFYADHCKIYQKRPIYWLFDSGKKNGFKALVYMHRYREDTIARMRTDYVHEQQSRYRTAIEDAENRLLSAEGTERVKISKALGKLKDQDEEIRAYEEKIHHLADQMIRIDLDDGVKNNYEIFKDVLAKIK